MIFTVTGTGRTYDYFFHARMQEAVPQHLDRYFGATCHAGGVAQLPESDRRGVQLGRVLPGMTKAGVLTAIGYPPLHATRRLEESVWTYWMSRFNRMKVMFSGDKVVQTLH